MNRRAGKGSGRLRLNDWPQELSAVGFSLHLVASSLCTPAYPPLLPHTCLPCPSAHRSTHRTWPPKTPEWATSQLWLNRDRLNSRSEILSAARTLPLSVGRQLWRLGDVPIRAPSKEELAAPLQGGKSAASLWLLILSGLPQLLSQGHVLGVMPANDCGPARL